MAKGPTGQPEPYRLNRRSCLGLGLGLLALGAGCKPIYSNHGYIPTEDELALVEVGRDTRATVSVTIGQPSATGLLADEAWYYVQSRFKTLGAGATTEIDRQVVVISFDEAGYVSNIERFGLERGEVVAISRRVTTTNVRGRSVLAQIFGNIGKLRTDGIFN